MRPLTDAQIRASFVNASRSERKNLTLPADFAERPWDRLDFLGWRDPKLPQVGYLVLDLDGELVGLLLRQTETRTRARAQCSWCSDIHLPNEVVFYMTKRVGDAGRRGDTVGTHVCENFECSHNARKLPPSAYLGFDREAARDRRIEQLREHVAGFVREVRGGV
ncbi:FBP domain-containing protein [Microbacterium sp. B2969]|uniref:FBP domain-containing protein n=1 Tax=Microbacterium alkaliflavum TaxID=3248839 RepID=A0ABW7Q323_9MICO